LIADIDSDIDEGGGNINTKLGNNGGGGVLAYQAVHHLETRILQLLETGPSWVDLVLLLVLEVSELMLLMEVLSTTQGYQIEWDLHLFLISGL
jgi:hypothetical protein